MTRGMCRYRLEHENEAHGSKKKKKALMKGGLKDTCDKPKRRSYLRQVSNNASEESSWRKTQAGLTITNFV